MPNKWTFKVKPIGEFISRNIRQYGGKWVDPFCGQSSVAHVTNDIEPDRGMYSMDALDFLKSMSDCSFNGCLFDPPYSVEQCLRKYTPKHGGTAGRAEYWARCKDEIARILKPGGVCISCCWDSVGVGANRGFVIKEILLVCHGACHNDTIVTLDAKEK